MSIAATRAPASSNGGGLIASAAPPPTGLDGRFKIYGITEIATGRQYVGVTSQTVEARHVGHLHDALRGKCRRPGGLAAAIIRAINAGMTYRLAFSVCCLETTDDADEARRLEAVWIARLRSAAPRGFNLMPGGSSLGGPLNSRPLVLIHGSEPQTFPSLSRAIHFTRHYRRQRCVRSGTIYARLASGWSPSEAFGLSPRIDGRRRRAPFFWRGHRYETLFEVSERSGIPVSTLRSRLHRSKPLAGGDPVDISGDRRALGIGKREGILVPAPVGSGLVTLQEFAALSDVPKATVTARYHQLRRAGRQPGDMEPGELAAFLIGRQERRILVELVISSETTWRGGVRALVRRVLDDWTTECRRTERISGSAIRRRLRQLPGWPSELTAADVRWAFGFESRTPPMTHATCDSGGAGSVAATDTAKRRPRPPL